MTAIPQANEVGPQPAVPAAIWVVDPRSGQRVDVAAFLGALHAFEPGHNAPLAQGALDSVKRTIRFLSLSVHDPVTTDPVELSNIFHDLWRLWDMFEATSTVNSPPDQGLARS